MSVRRLLLIDSDPEFQRLLESRLGPHGFVVLTPPDPGNPLGQVKELNPVVIFIAVELPDKIGYALCNKAKKGPAGHVPVVLVTSTVPASGFKSHRKLKVHADEYIDKRTMTPEEVLRVVDSLIGLGNYVPQPAEDMDVEELDVDDLDGVEVVEDEPRAPDEFAADQDAAPEPVPDHKSGPPAEASGGFHEGAFGGDVDDLADEIDRAMDEVSGVREMPHVLFAMNSGLAALRSGDDVLSSTDPVQALDDVDLPSDGGDFADQTAVASPPNDPVPASASDDAESPIEDELDAAEPPAEEPVAAAQAPEPVAAPQAPEPVPPVVAAGSGADLDLGLEEVASQAEEEKSGVHDRRYQVKVLQLEEEIARLKAQLDDVRRQPASGGAFSREREFLNLREVINKKEKEILELRESLATRDGEILKFRQTIRELRQERTEFDEKNVELEREMLNVRERLDEIEAERTRLIEQKQGVEKVLAAARAELQRVNEELGTERSSRREEIESLARERARALDDLRQELEDARTRAEENLRQQHDRDLRSLKEAYEETARDKEAEAARRLEEQRADADARREQAFGELRREHAAALEKIESEKAAERAAAVSALEARLESELADADRRRQRELTEAERRRVMELAEADNRRDAELAAAAEKHAAAENALVEKFEGERAALDQEHREKLAAVESRITAHEVTIRGLEADLDNVREAERSRVETIESLHRMLADRDQRISNLRSEIDELERVNTGYQDQILRAHQKIRSDETTVSRAKKALAVALTLLDEPDGGGATRGEASGNGR